MNRDTSLDVAVTGMFARLPGMSDHTGLAGWWQALCAGEVLTTRLTREQLLDAGVPARIVDDPDYVPVWGHLADADRFDNELFGISPREAELMDPQHRLMLEAAWAVLEDAGRAPTDDRLRTAVYASATSSAYTRRILAGGALPAEQQSRLELATGRDYMATRIAYRLGLKGPAISVLTACSSSLVAVHLAVQALINGDCDQALVVAASVGSPQAGHLRLRSGIMSMDGTCRPFDAGADGTVGGSGVAAVVLRRLEEAEADGDRPHGVIIGSAINNDGAAKAGYNAPSAQGQETVIRAALHAANVPANSLGYLEAHATGTYVGDPIEWSAMSAALSKAGAHPGQVAVGAVKANIGHLDAASGLVSLVKALLVTGHGTLPPVANFDRLNPLLTSADSPLFVPMRAQPWPGPQPRRAGISSFGIGGTNAHVIIEQAPEGPGRVGHPIDRDSVVLLSAADPAALRRSALRLSTQLTGSTAGIADVAYTLAVGRTALPHRLAVAGRSVGEIADRLAASAPSNTGIRPVNGPNPLVFLFPGQGSQHPGMARPFRDHLPSFMPALDECLGAFEPALADAVRASLLDAEFPADLLNRTELAQPALFALEYAATRALSGVGLTPVALAGHSLGEITSACVAGVLDLSAAARLVVTRAHAMQACPPGAMLAIGCAEQDVVALLAEASRAVQIQAVELAAVNSAAGCVVAGPVAQIDALGCWIGDRVFHRRLRTSHAFHSALIEPAVSALRQELAGLHLGRPAIPFVANATGELVGTGTRIDADLLADGARRPVRFGDGMTAIAQRFPGAIAVEVGPGQALCGVAAGVDLTAIPLSPGRGTRPGEELLLALGALWANGQPVDFTASQDQGRRLHLPTYPFFGARHVAPEALAVREQQPAGGAGPTPDPSSPTAAQPALETVRAVVTQLWAEALGYEHLADNADFIRLGGDSLNIIRLARRLMKNLAIEIPIRELMAARTLADHIRLVESLIHEQRPATPAESEAQRHGPSVQAGRGWEIRSD